MSRRRLVAVLALAAVVAASGVALVLRQQVRRALEAPPGDARPLQLVALERPLRPLETWAGPEVEAVAFPGGDLVTAGASGVWHARRGDLSAGLPSRRAVALALWAGDPVVALEAGGLALERGGAWHELRSGWGALHARALAEAPGGELLIGAREGLFRVAVGGTALQRLDAHPVRALAAGPGFVLAGGEQGLLRVQPGRATPVATPDPWIESLAVAGDTVFAVSARGLARGPSGGPLEPVRGGEAIAQAAWHDGRLWAVSDPPANALRVIEADGTTREEALPATARRVLSASGVLFADTVDGLERRDPDGWHLALPPRATLPPGPAHVTALARFHGRLFAGLFDRPASPSLKRRAAASTGSPCPGRRRGASTPCSWPAASCGSPACAVRLRFDGEVLRAVAGPGAAFSLAATREGVAIGFGQGVLLPGATLLSAFHGLPGNQALALVEQDALFVGTPSGLGALGGRRVLWRVTGGEGKLPHPWVTALLPQQDGLLVGTWGGGLVRRRAGPAPGTPRGGEDARWEPFVETARLAVSPGALAETEGRAWAGTDADGLWRQSADRARFERVRAPAVVARQRAARRTRRALAGHGPGRRACADRCRGLARPEGSRG